MFPKGYFLKVLYLHSTLTIWILDQRKKNNVNFLFSLFFVVPEKYVLKVALLFKEFFKRIVKLKSFLNFFHDMFLNQSGR